MPEQIQNEQAHIYKGGWCIRNAIWAASDSGNLTSSKWDSDVEAGSLWTPAPIDSCLRCIILKENVNLLRKRGEDHTWYARSVGPSSRKPGSCNIFASWGLSDSETLSHSQGEILGLKVSCYWKKIETTCVVLSFRCGQTTIYSLIYEQVPSWMLWGRNGWAISASSTDQGEVM